MRVPLRRVAHAGDGVLGEDSPARAPSLAFPRRRRKPLRAVDRDADQLLLQVEVAQAVAVVKHGLRVVQFELDPVEADLRHPADGLARVLRRVERADVVLPAVDEVVGELAVEVLVGIGREAERRAAARSARQREIRALARPDQLVQQLTVVRRDVLHVAHVLVAALDHDPREADVLQEARLLRGADVGLGAGMQLDRRQVELQQPHVLDDQHVGAGVVDIPGHAARRLQLVVAQDGVVRDEDAGAETVRMPDQPLDLTHVVAGRSAGAEGWPADVDGVGAVVHGFDADVGVARGGEQFELVGQEGHRA